MRAGRHIIKAYFWASKRIGPWIPGHKKRQAARIRAMGRAMQDLAEQLKARAATMTDEELLASFSTSPKPKEGK